MYMCTHTHTHTHVTGGEKKALDSRILVAAGATTDVPLYYRSGATFGFCLSTHDR